MGSSDDLINTVEDSIRAPAQKAARSSSSDVSREYAQAVNQLTEARAWLRSVSQPHGGSWHTRTTPSSS